MEELICIVCPIGCHLKVEEKDGQWKVSGNKCPRGEKYGILEVTAPTRMLTSTVGIDGNEFARLPVKTSCPIPKGMIVEAMDMVKQCKVKLPIKQGDVIISHLLGTDANLVATKSMC